MDFAYLTHILILVSIFGMLALSLNMLVGFTGLLSLAHAAFFGVGAYTIAIMLGMYHGNFFLALLLASVFAVVISTAIGLVFSRFRDDYYALATLGFNVILASFLLNAESITRGPLGIPGIPRPELFGISFGSNSSFLVLAFIFFLATYFCMKYIARTSFGRVLKAVREDEEALKVFGYRTHSYKLVIFSISAVIATVAGGLFASYISYVDPSTFTVNDSIFMLSMVIVGGLGSVRGSVLGAIILVIIPELLRFVGFSPDMAAQMRALFYGAVLVLLMMYRPQGLIGEYKL